MLKKLILLPLSFITFNVYSANPYTDCGIGAALFPNTSWAAVTSNVIWDVGTTAVISATASDQTCSGGDVQTAQLIHDKYELLETDLILSEGDNLLALTNSIGCNNSPSLRKSLKEDIKRLLSADEYATNSRIQKASNLYDAIKSNKTVIDSCKRPA